MSANIGVASVLGSQAEIDGICEIYIKFKRTLIKIFVCALGTRVRNKLECLFSTKTFSASVLTFLHKVVSICYSLRSKLHKLCPKTFVKMLYAISLGVFQ
jgi:hypothetical protein